MLHSTTLRVCSSVFSGIMRPFQTYVHWPLCYPGQIVNGIAILTSESTIVL